MSERYGKRIDGRRFSRRKILAAASALGAGAAAVTLVGCGGSGNSEKETGAGLLTRPRDRSREAARGGTYQFYEASDIQGFDPNGGTSVRAQAVANFTYLRLIKNQTSFDGTQSSSQDGDLAERWEFAGDGLQLTLRLRPNVVWDQRPPTSGRRTDAQDVKFSADRFLAVSPHATNFFNAKSEAAPIRTLEVPDASSVVMKLAFPYVPLLATLVRGLNMWTLPRESDGGFNPKSDVRGNGPWILEDYQPSALLEFRRNPDYYVKDRPFLDRWSAPIVPEYATQLAQFRAGNIWHGVARQEDVIGLKRSFSQLNMYEGDYGFGTPQIYFGFQGQFKDARLRQAVPYIIDRQLIADILSDSAKFEAEGLPKATRINTHIGAGWEDYWLNPFGKEFGENAKYYKIDLSEARKLVIAAGLTGKVKTKFFYPHNGYPGQYQQMVPMLSDMLNQSDLFDVQLAPLDYQSDYIPNIHFGGAQVGAWDGISLTPAGQGDDPGHQLLVQYHSSGAATRQPKGVDPKLDQMIEAQLRETDPKKRLDLIHDIQRYMPTTMISVPAGYQAAGFWLAWPWVGNAGAVRGQLPASEVYPYLWYDKAAYDSGRPS